MQAMRAVRTFTVGFTLSTPLKTLMAFPLDSNVSEPSAQPSVG